MGNRSLDSLLLGLSYLLIALSQTSPLVPATEASEVLDSPIVASETTKSPHDNVLTASPTKSSRKLSPTTVETGASTYVINTSPAISGTFPPNKPTTTLAQDANKSPDIVVTSTSTSGTFPSLETATSLSRNMSRITTTSSRMSRSLSTGKPVQVTSVTQETPKRATSRENETREATEHDHILKLVSYIGIGFSIVALFLAFLTFFCLRFKKTEHHFIHANLALSLVFAESLFLFGIPRMEYQMVCKIIAVVLHYLFLVAFCWMALEGVMLYLMMVNVFQTNIPLNKGKIVFFLCGWGIPVLLVGVTATLFYEEYGTDDFCWLSVHSHVVWALFAPGLLVCLFNFACLVKTFRVMAERRKLNHNRDRVARIRFWAKGCALLSCLLGITWMLGVFVVNETTPFMVYLFNVFNTLQGPLIFIFHCLGDEKIRTEYMTIFHCGTKRAYGLVRQWSKTDAKSKEGAVTYSKEQETMETKVDSDSPEDTFKKSHLAGCRRSLQDSTDKRVSATSGDYKRGSQEVGGSKRQSQEWTCGWTRPEEEPEESFAMDVFSSLKGVGCRDFPVVESGTPYDQQFGLCSTQNGFKSFKVPRVKKQEDAIPENDSRIELYEDKSTAEKC